MSEWSIDEEALRGRRELAAQAWSALLGDSTACTLAKNGHSFPAAKYHEGGTVALGELLRTIRALPAGGSQLTALTTVRERWVRMAATAEGADWRAYAAGGADALAIGDPDWGPVSADLTPAPRRRSTPQAIDDVDTVKTPGPVFG